MSTVLGNPPESAATPIPAPGLTLAERSMMRRRYQRTTRCDQPRAQAAQFSRRSIAVAVAIAATACSGLASGFVGTASAAPRASVPMAVEMAVSGEPTLSPGATGDAVQTLQNALNQALAPLGLIADGVFGPRTEDAVIQFQKSKDLTPDGIVGPQTWGALPSVASRPLLQQGSSGDVVRRLQQVLTDGAPGQWGTTPAGVDGIFGPQTAASVEAFQQWANIPADGIVGNQTWSVSLHAAGATLASEVGV